MKNKSCQELFSTPSTAVKRQIPSSSTSRRCRLIIPYIKTVTILKCKFQCFVYLWSCLSLYNYRTFLSSLKENLNHPPQHQLFFFRILLIHVLFAHLCLLWSFHIHVTVRYITAYTWFNFWITINVVAHTSTFSFWWLNNIILSTSLSDIKLFFFSRWLDKNLNIYSCPVTVEFKCKVMWTWGRHLWNSDKCFGSPEAVLQAVVNLVMWVVENEFYSSEGANTLNYGAIYPDHKCKEMKMSCCMGTFHWCCLSKASLHGHCWPLSELVDYICNIF